MEVIQRLKLATIMTVLNQSIANGLNGQKLAPALKPVEKVSKIIVEESYHILQMEKIASESQQAKNIATPTVVYHHGPMALQ